MQHPPSAEKARIFFPNLDGWRFISFFAVFLYHCQLAFFEFMKTSHPALFGTLEFLFRNGNLGVNFFFVLSGFLITFLLIKEKEFTGTIHVGNFYVRRILRIWPLYYMCLLLGFVLFPIFKQMTGEPIHETANGFYYLVFAANFDYMHIWPQKPEAILLSVLWSVAVEEQFYLAWPLILRLVPMRWYRFLFPGIMLFSLVFRSFHTGCTEAEHAVRYFHTFSLIGDMALGGLLAYYCSFPNRFKTFITNLSKPVIIFLYLLTAVLCLFRDSIFACGVPVIFERIVIGALFGFIIVEQNYATHSFFKMSRFRTITRLGVYTYGLYCLHVMGMYFAMKVIVKTHLTLGFASTAFVSFAVALMLTIIIGLISYHFYEKWFLRLKNKFAFITK